MKKVLLILAALAVAAAPALADPITGTKHDLTHAANSVKTTDYDEICVFCHTPHDANVAVTNAPLWNRSYSLPVTLVAADLYTSTTLEVASMPATVFAGIGATDAPLCFSCHDGASVSPALQNPLNSFLNADPTIVGVLGSGNILGDAAKLKNDHPIGMVYLDAYNSENANPAKQGLLAVPNGLNLYGGKMWCSSCHDVHDNEFPPFLAKSNTGSALCLSCHDK